MLPRRPLLALLSAGMLPPLALFAQLQPVGLGPIAGGHNLTGRSALSDTIAQHGSIPTFSAVAPRYVVVGPGVTDSLLRALDVRYDVAPMSLDSLTYHRKSGLTAFALSALIAGGGQLYAGEKKKGVALMLLELGGVALAASADALAGDAAYADAAPIFAGVLIAGGSWIYSMADAPRAARRYNYKHALARPIVGIEPGHTARLGVRVALGM